MIPNREGCHYLAVKKLSALLRGITSKNHGDFYSLYCLYSFQQKTNMFFNFELLTRKWKNKS